jgi:hypothetical protein
LKVEGISLIFRGYNLGLFHEIFEV